jgi:hypothetical protein
VNAKPLVEIRDAKRKIEADLLSRPGVSGVDIGPKIVKGQKTEELSIRVYVAEKKDVPAKEKIPETIDGIKTDVIQRRIVLHPAKVPVTEVTPAADTNTYDPLRGGISIGPCRAIGGFVFVGTLGAIVRDNASGDPMLLSNFHVMAVDTAWSVGDTMAQPGRPDGGSCPGGVVGTLQRAVLGGTVDCAVAKQTARNNVCEIVEIGPVAGTASATPEMHVRKRGRTSGLTHGRIETVDLTVAVDYEDGLGVVTLANQIGIEVDTSQSAIFGTNGDSGSVVVDDNRNIVGLYFAGTEDGTFGVANPIHDVLNALNVSVCVAPSKVFAAKPGEAEKPAKETEKKIETKEIEKKIEFKDHKQEKIEFKDLKDPLKEKLEKLEKQEKPEKREIKEFKDLKDPLKEKLEKIEKREKPEIKDLKDPLKEKIEKFEKPEKPEIKEFEKDPAEKQPFEGKGIREDGPLGPGPVAPQPRPQSAGASVEDRLTRLEAAMAELAHFISPELRPDLSQGALTREPDLGTGGAAALSQQLQKQAVDAKQAKDAKDVEKLREQ